MIKAIETHYNGYRFRSRLEARWAYFFDKIGIDYNYEPEGFDLDGVWYLPDFKLTSFSFDIWVEVKPTWPTEDELCKLISLKIALNKKLLEKKEQQKNCIFICGSPGVPSLSYDDSGWKIKNGSYAIINPMLAGENDVALFIEAYAMVDGGTILDVWPYYFCRLEDFSLDKISTIKPIMAFGADHDGNKTELRCGFVNPVFPNQAAARMYFGRGVSYDAKKLKNAYRAARSARFEHGETPNG